MQPTRRHVPPSAGSALDAGDLAAELRRADRGRVAGRAASEDCDVDVHRRRTLRSVGSAERGASMVTESSSSATRCEAVALVELDRAGVRAVDAERDRSDSRRRARALEQRLEERRADALAARVRDDGDRELGRPLVDEAVPGRSPVEQPVPGGPDRESPCRARSRPCRRGAPRPSRRGRRGRARCRARAPSSSRRGGACRGGTARPARRPAGRRRCSARRRVTARARAARSARRASAGTARRPRRRSRGGRRSAIIRRIGATSSVAVADDRLVLHGADREDRDLRRVEDGGELLDAEHPEVRDRERPALHVLRA